MFKSDLSEVDDDFEVPLKKKKKFEFPFDCVGEILKFVADSTIINRFLQLSKALKDYISNDFDCSKKTRFVMKKIPRYRKTYVTSLSVDETFCKRDNTNNEILIDRFPNLRILELNNQIQITDEVFKSLNKIEKLVLQNTPNIGNDGFVHIEKTLKCLVLDRSHSSTHLPESEYQITDKALYLLSNLTHLEIHEFPSKFQFLFCSAKIRKFRATGMTYSSNFLDSWVDSLEVIELRRVDQFDPKILEKMKKLRKVTLIECEEVTEQEVRKYLGNHPGPVEIEVIEMRIEMRGRVVRPGPIEGVIRILDSIF